MLSSRFLALGRSLVTGTCSSRFAGATACRSTAPIACRFKSSSAAEVAAEEHRVEEELAIPFESSASASSTGTATDAVDTEAATNISEDTFNRSKQGTPSPWAVFDAWGAGADIVEPLSPEMEAILTHEAVAIPSNEDERAALPGETDILAAYDQHLQRKSSVHFGYPYNLMFDFTELQGFMNYSINNLGDPYVPSNYQVHSRQFECAVIDFFAKLWKMEPDSYWVRNTLVFYLCCMLALLARRSLGLMDGWMDGFDLNQEFSSYLSFCSLSILFLYLLLCPLRCSFHLNFYLSFPSVPSCLFRFENVRCNFGNRIAHLDILFLPIDYYLSHNNNNNIEIEKQ
jgi:hypothetical protein